MKLIYALLLAAASVPTAAAATIDVPAGGNLQAAINAAQPGDTIRLEPGATYVGNFVLPAHAGGAYITIRTGGDDALLPPPGMRMTPAYAPYLARIVSPGVAPAIRLAAGAGYWRLELLEFPATVKGTYDILQLGDGSSKQNTLERMPHHIIVDRVYLHGDRAMGQKRGIALNSASTTIVNSYVSDIKAAGQDSQAIAGWNGTGPYHIENNYLEAAGNVILIGGDDPKIPGLVATDITVRGNVLTRPLSWRDPIVPTPANVRATAGSGALPAATYAYLVVARADLGSSGTGNSVPSEEVAVTVGNGGAVTLTWSPVADAKDYVVFGRTPGGQALYWITTATSFTDNGLVTPKSSAPVKPTVWTVKNLFELKNARAVQVDHNVMENNWAQAQNGVAVLFTPRNQYGDATWAVVEDVTFEHNIIRHVGAGVTITGYDNRHPSQQTNSIRIRHNEFSDYSKTWGGSGYFLLLDNEPRDITIDHNTLISGSGAGIVMLSGPPMSGVAITNNVARHDKYGIFGSGYGYGNSAISHYLPGALVTRNVLAGGPASSYPSGNLFPSVDAFAEHFVDYAGMDFSLVPGTDWAFAATDGLDLGAAMGELGWHSESAQVEPPSIVTEAVADGTEGAAYETTLEATGGRAPYSWSLFEGMLPAGLLLDPQSGTIAGAPVAEGDAIFTIELTDADGATVRKPLTLHVERAIAPVTIATLVLPEGTAKMPYAVALEAEGGLGTYSWSVAGGALPAGYALSDNGVISGTTPAAVTLDVTLMVSDAADPSRSATRSFTLMVVPPPNIAPVVALDPVTGPVQLAAPIALTAQALDSDGFITRVDFLVDGELAGTATAAPFTFTWDATAGDHTLSARAMDDAGALATSAEVVVTPTAEIVLHASDRARMVGDYQIDPDPTAADTQSLWNPNHYAAKKPSASAAPSTYAEFQFYAEAGRPYHIWLRSRAQRNEFGNDSAFLQFSGMEGAAIGTTDALIYQLEDAPTAGLSRWGWQDNGLGTEPNQAGTHLVFPASGLQTLRIQPREDGLSIDQIVISPDRYLLVAPGSLKDDGTIVGR
ncbi:MAG: putative Ig domain-containing protein [Vicinamibacterales bacterium]